MAGCGNDWDGFNGACGDTAGVNLDGKGDEFHWDKIIGPVRKIDYYVRNLCNKPVIIDGDDCCSKFIDLMNCCEWTWDTHKGGYWDHECLSRVYAPNRR